MICSRMDLGVFCRLKANPARHPITPPEVFMSRFALGVLMVLLLAACSFIPFKRIDQVASARSALDQDRAEATLNAAFRRTAGQRGVCSTFLDPVVTVDGDRSAIVRYPFVQVRLSKSVSGATMRVGGVTATSSSTRPTVVPDEFDLRRMKRIYVGKTDGRCGLAGEPYMLTLAFPSTTLQVQVPPAKLIDVLASLTFQNSVEIVYAEDGTVD